MDCIKISINPSWNDKIADVSACIDSWIKIRTEFRPRLYLETDRFNMDKRAIYIVYESEEEKNAVLELLEKEKSDKLICEIKTIKVFGSMRNRVYPENISRGSISVHYYNAIYSWLSAEICAYEQSTEFRSDNTMMRYRNELTNVIGRMKFVNAARCVIL